MLVGYGKRGSKVNVSFQVDIDGVNPNYSADSGTIKGGNRFKLKEDVTAAALTFVTDADINWVAVGDTWVFEDDPIEVFTVATITDGTITVTTRAVGAKPHQAGDYMYFLVLTATPTMSSAGVISFVIPQATSKKIKDRLYCVLYRKANGTGESIGEPPNDYYEVAVDGLVGVTV